jgi:hypothetical protein
VAFALHEQLGPNLCKAGAPVEANHIVKVIYVIIAYFEVAIQSSQSLRMQGLREAEKILWVHANETPARTLDIRDEKECDGNKKRQNQR